MCIFGVKGELLLFVKLCEGTFVENIPVVVLVHQNLIV